MAALGPRVHAGSAEQAAAQRELPSGTVALVDRGHLTHSLVHDPGPAQCTTHLDCTSTHRLWRNLSFPKALWPLVTPKVLVETFEQGQLIHSFVDNPHNPHNAELANIGRDCFLKMLLNDNFIHAGALQLLLQRSPPCSAGHWMPTRSLHQTLPPAASCWQPCRTSACVLWRVEQSARPGTCAAMRGLLPPVRDLGVRPPDKQRQAGCCKAGA